MSEMRKVLLLILAASLPSFILAAINLRVSKQYFAAAVHLIG
jgi:hypothetical protein